MPGRFIDDDVELPDYDEFGDDDAQWLGSGNFLRPRQRRTVSLWVFVWPTVLLIGLAAYFTFIDLPQRQARDAFCVSCHTNAHTQYLARATQAQNSGDLPTDLASFHYQRIFVSGGEMRCIHCHRGDDGLAHRVNSAGLSAWMTALWLTERDDPRVEKTTITGTAQLNDVDGSSQTVTLWPNIAPPPGLELAQNEYRFVYSVTRRITRTLGMPALHAPVLSNAGCVGCHQNTLLVAGQGNHFHNNLPAAYELWKNGAKLIPPPGEAETQALVARGLVRYETRLQCSGCHQAHRGIEADKYLDWVGAVPLACVQCHRDVEAGPLVVDFGVVE
jgi:predicted CXXCH cytochrome family protein